MLERKIDFFKKLRFGQDQKVMKIRNKQSSSIIIEQIDKSTIYSINIPQQFTFLNQT